ncbi:MAG TPA: tRNA 2-thiouridine(34) synthase MnmA [Spirochaetota bacterium]|nr:tRNA 2-thiouridine(34) synthase MnmA [Spirochaetota bacterium]
MSNVTVAMSGGVDSSLAAYSLLQKGYTVSGITMIFRILFPDGSSFQIGEQSADDVSKICSQLGIRHQIVDYTESFNDFVVTDFTRNYLEGRTPNPCIICNKKVKFGELADQAFQNGSDFFATGHYSSIVNINDQYFIKRNPLDPKDQTYFLYKIRKEILPKIIFPLSGMQKSTVRSEADKANLITASKKDSQDICFLPDGDYRNFISKFISKSDVCASSGNFVDREGKILGKHNGFFNYTIGQRRGLGVAYSHPLYVSGFNIEKNEVILSKKDELFSKSLTASDINLFSSLDNGEYQLKTRYAQRDKKCTVKVTDNELLIEFLEPIDAVTKGQSAVLYRDDLLIGGGIIDDVFY